MMKIFSSFTFPKSATMVCLLLLLWGNFHSIDAYRCSRCGSGSYSAVFPIMRDPIAPDGLENGVCEYTNEVDLDIDVDFTCICPLFTFDYVSGDSPANSRLNPYRGDSICDERFCGAGDSLSVCDETIATDQCACPYCTCEIDYGEICKAGKCSFTYQCGSDLYICWNMIDPEDIIALNIIPEEELDDLNFIHCDDLGDNALILSDDDACENFVGCDLAKYRGEYYTSGANPQLMSASDVQAELISRFGDSNICPNGEDLKITKFCATTTGETLYDGDSGDYDFAGFPFCSFDGDCGLTGSGSVTLEFGPSSEPSMEPTSEPSMKPSQEPSSTPSALIAVIQFLEELLKLPNRFMTNLFGRWRT